MIRLFIYTGIIIYMEVVFHLGNFGLQSCNPLFLIGLTVTISSLQALIGGCFGPKGEKRAFRIMVWAQYLVFAAQAVFYHIFREPLRITAVMVNGQDALGSYWKEALTGTLQTVPLLILLALPIIALEILRKVKKWEGRRLSVIQKLRLGLVSWAALLYTVSCILVGNMVGADFSEEYGEYYDPATVMRNMGVLAMVQRDGFYEIQNLLGSFAETTPVLPVLAQDTPPESESKSPEPPPEPLGESQGTEDTDTAGETPQPEESPAPPEPDTSPNVWNINLEMLAEIGRAHV